MGDPQVAQFASWDACATKASAADYLAATILPQPWYRAICLHERPVGFVAARPGTAIDRCRAELSYGVAEIYVAAAAVGMAVAALFAELPELERVEGLVAVENKASKRVLGKAGFVRGVLRRYRVVRGKLWDMVCDSLTHPDLP
ncbi:unnamed protein product [Spirodela intermedia]|uniref:N-acetyltransferase domain-containing protein n=1 Tax=Spirodela intermedia TaxID=51605 RepID=A0A7I8KCL6_SPIIN|nr:unnamed protein product [Spirodela intermedia]